MIDSALKKIPKGGHLEEYVG